MTTTTPRQSVLILVVLALSLSTRTTLAQEEYGADVSFPMKHHFVSKEQPIGPGKQEFYNDFLKGCHDYFGSDAERCDWCENDRIDMNLNQPKMMKNFTSAGFAKIKAPANTMKILTDFWNKNRGQEVQEEWPKGNTYTNQWKSKTSMLTLHHNTLEGGGSDTVETIRSEVKPILESWARVENLQPTSLYGIRIYKRDSVLAPHVDRTPLILSVIINVAQDVEEPWILEVVSHDGVAHNVTMEPGDMVLYESHSVIHGRPFPLVGDYYANVFVHFEPLGFSEEYRYVKGGEEDDYNDDLDEEEEEEVDAEEEL